jgi:7-keto-8-aminopelargonate synthetase-like enzyme
VVDDAHGSGVLGPDGRGTVAALGCEGRVHALVATLSKALGSQGGYVAGSSQLVVWLRNRARGFVFDTSSSPAAVAAAAAAGRVARAEPWRREVARTRAQQLADGLRAAGWDVPEVTTPIVPVTVGSATAALALMERLLARDVLAVAIRPPTVPARTARVRATTLATHSEQDVAHALRGFGTAREVAA